MIPVIGIGRIDHYIGIVLFNRMWQMKFCFKRIKLFTYYYNPEQFLYSYKQHITRWNWFFGISKDFDFN